jgi:hypothetical protein
MGRPSVESKGFLRKGLALPSEHGSWVWWLGPFAIGIAAGGRPGKDLLALAVGALAGFLIHQPAAIAVKALVGRRPPADLRPALGWVALYAAVGAIAAPCLIASGHAYVLALLAPGAAVFAWHLWLVARREERRQMLLQILAAGGLALAAPAAYWVCGGRRYPEPWVLWTLCWAQSAASIASVFLALEQRRWPGVPPVTVRLRAARLSLSFAIGSLLLAAGFVAIRHAPLTVMIPFGLVLGDALFTALRPCVGRRPARVGLRQLIATAAFVAAMILAWR